ncbi:MAG: type II toxin-antitoxin system HicA family toxin [archaeon]|nr:type II toxin-antitoxin system HicA family toxin [archaeon]
MKPVSARKLVKLVETLGFKQTRIKGSHFRFVHPDGRKATIPVHGNEPIGESLLNKIIKKDLQMGKKEFFKLLSE